MPPLPKEALFEEPRLAAFELQKIADAIRIAPESGPVAATLIDFVAGLYDGANFPFNLNRLRVLSPALQNACCVCLRYDLKSHSPDVHQWGIFSEKELRTWMDVNGLFYGAQQVAIGRALYYQRYPDCHPIEGPRPARGEELEYTTLPVRE